MKSAFPSWREWLALAVVAAVLLVAGVGCSPAPPATKAPATNDSGDREQIPNPPKRDPG
jgi:hypothetical protein